MKNLGAVGEERRAAFTEVEPPGVQRGERGYELDGRLAFARSQARDLGEELLVRKIGETRDRVRHVSGIASQFLPLEDARGQTIIGPALVRMPDLQRTAHRQWWGVWRPIYARFARSFR